MIYGSLPLSCNGCPPWIDRATRPGNFLLGIAEVAKADYLVSGDRAAVLALVKDGPTRMVGVQTFKRVLDA